MKVRIEHLTITDDYDDREATRVYINDILIGEGTYGGDPEDNCSYRTYSWVEPLLLELGRHLDNGAKIEDRTITWDEYYG